MLLKTKVRNNEALFLSPSPANTGNSGASKVILTHLRTKTRRAILYTFMEQNVCLLVCKI